MLDTTDLFRTSNLLGFEGSNLDFFWGSSRVDLRILEQSKIFFRDPAGHVFFVRNKLKF